VPSVTDHDLHPPSTRPAATTGSGSVGTLATMPHSTHQALADERNESVEIFINGEFFARHEARVSVFDSGFLVGDGIWE
jgi:hypothetical protein